MCYKIISGEVSLHCNLFDLTDFIQTRGHKYKLTATDHEDAWTCRQELNCSNPPCHALGQRSSPHCVTVVAILLNDHGSFSLKYRDSLLLRGMWVGSWLCGKCTISCLHLAV